MTGSTRNGESTPSDSDPLIAPQVELSETVLRALDEIELEAGSNSEVACRICLESGDSENELISPCMCKGTQQFVHRSCLDHWRAVKEGFAFSHCTTCKARFHLIRTLPEDHLWRQRKFQMFVTRDICIIFLALQVAVILLATIVAFLDKQGSLLKSSEWFTQHPHFFYYCWGLFVFLVLFGIAGLIFHCSYGSQLDIGPCGSACAGNCGTEIAMGAGAEVLIIVIVVFALLGAIYGVLAAMLAWQRIWQRHYHILTKKVLAEEYVVKDMEGCYSAPTLDSADEARLKSLGLI